MTKKLKKKIHEKTLQPSDERVRDASDLRHTELSGPSERNQSTNYTNTDENENEGLGDGKTGRSTPDPFEK
jgi:hypothetical protein